MSFKQLLTFSILQLLLHCEKNCKIIFFRSLVLVYENTPKVVSIGPLIAERRPFKKLKILSVLARFIPKIKKVHILNFLSVKYFGKRFLFLKIWNVRVDYCENYGSSNLLFCFTGHKLEQLKNRRRETDVNSLVHSFDS